MLIYPGEYVNLGRRLATIGADENFARVHQPVSVSRSLDTNSRIHLDTNADFMLVFKLFQS